MSDILYLASQSPSRKSLLETVGISYKLLAHASDECGIESPHDFQAHVLSIASDKMRTTILPSRESVGLDYLFVLTADTLVRSATSLQIFGKPRDKEHGRQMLQTLAKEKAEVVTGCCVEKMVFEQGVWRVELAHHWTTTSLVEFVVEADEIDFYYEHFPAALSAAGGAMIEGFGGYFVRSVNGSYTSVQGLPLFELRKALKAMSFKF